MIAGKATPKQARMMCQPSDNAICWRAGIRPAGSAADVVWVGSNTFAANRVFTVAGWQAPASARVSLVGMLGVGFGEALALAPGGAVYRFSLRGMIRTTNLDGDPWRYRVQVGYLHGPMSDWRKVQNWTDVGWDTYYPRTEPGAFSDYQTTLRAQHEQITLFIRVWKKWGLTDEEVDVNLDAITLVKVGGPPPSKK